MFDVWPVGDPGHQTQGGADRGTHHSDGEAVGPHHQADVLVCGAEGAQHADGPHPALGQDGEAAHGHEPDEEHAEGGDEDHENLGIEAAVQRVRRGLHVLMKRGQLGRGTVEEQRHLAGARQRARWYEGKLVEQVLGILHDPDHVPRDAGVMPDTSHVEREVRGHAGGNGYLAGRPGVAPAHQIQHGLAVGAIGVLGSQLIGANRSGDLDRDVLDDVDRAYLVLEGGDSRSQLGIGGGQLDHGVGRSEAGLAQRGRVHGHAGTHDGDGYRHGDQSENQQLLTPFAEEQSPRPPGYGTACGGAAVARSQIDSRAVQGERHWPGTRSSSVSGPD